MDPVFYKLDIRVGAIEKVWTHPESEKLYCEYVSVGEDSSRQIASGLQQHVPLSEMTGQVLVLVNLKPRKLAGFESQGMIMCGKSDDGAKVELLLPVGQCKVGERLFLEGDSPDLEAFNKEFIGFLNPKKKEMENAFVDLKLDEEGFCVFKGKRLVTGTGVQFKCKTLFKVFVS